MDNQEIRTTPGELIQVIQLPVIQERLRSMKGAIEQEVSEALSLACTEDTIQTVKGKRAELRKLLDSLEAQRKAVKTAVMGPYNHFESVYKECVSDTLKSADAALKNKIDEVETEQKRRCEEGLRDYFVELCAVHHLDWLTYEQAGIKVDMASAKAKTPGKLRKQLAEFVIGANDGVNLISSMDNAEEIMVEFRECLDASRAIAIVLERRRRIEEQKAAQEARKSAMERGAETVRRVEALAPPVVVKAGENDQNEVIPRLTFTCINATRAQLRRVREFLNMEGIQYE